MVIVIEQNIDCENISLQECSDNILAALGHGVGLKLKADKADDTVNGFVTIIHNDRPLKHLIEIHLYEETEAPTAVMVRGVLVGRQTTLAKLKTMPTEKELSDKLAALGLTADELAAL